MALLISPDTAYGKELWKWDHDRGQTHPSDPTVKGMRAPCFEPYPAMMYKATQKNPWKFDQEVAADEQAQRNLESRGFIAGGKQAAADAFDTDMQKLAVAAAERNAQDRHMSEKARAESNAAEQASAKHLGEIPATPIKKRGRKSKVVTTA